MFVFVLLSYSRLYPVLTVDNVAGCMWYVYDYTVVTLLELNIVQLLKVLQGVHAGTSNICFTIHNPRFLI